MLLQETYEVLDAWFYDEGIYGHKNTNWTGGLSAEVKDTYTELTSSSSSYSRYTVGATLDLTDDFCIEFDTPIAPESNTHFMLLASSSNNINLGNKGAIDGSHFKITIQNGQGSCVVDNGTPVSVTVPSNMTGLAFQINGTTPKIRYANFKIYPI